MSDISFAQFDLLSAMDATDFVVGYRGTREVRLTYLSLISGISGVATGLDEGSLKSFLATNNVVTSAGTVLTNLSVGGNLYTNNEILVLGTGVPTISSNSSLYISAPSRVFINQSPLRVCNISTAERSTLSPLTGDIIYNNTTNTFQGYSSTGWVDLG